MSLVIQMKQVLFEGVFVYVCMCLQVCVRVGICACSIYAYMHACMHILLLMYVHTSL